MREPVLSGRPNWSAGCRKHFPRLSRRQRPFGEKVWHGGVRMRLGLDPKTLRPGGTISGPTMMMLADVTMYVAILASIGWEPLAVTTNLNMNFLRKPAPGALLSECKLIKLGRRLAVGEVAIRSEGEEEMVAHATSTYSIPPRNSRLRAGNYNTKIVSN